MKKLKKDNKQMYIPLPGDFVTKFKKKCGFCCNLYMVFVNEKE